MIKVRKEKFNLKEGSAYVVADEIFWNHVIAMYESQAEDSEDEWQQMADHVRYWVSSTIFHPEDGEGWA